MRKPTKYTFENKSSKLTVVVHSRFQKDAREQLLQELDIHTKELPDEWKLVRIELPKN